MHSTVHRLPSTRLHNAQQEYFATELPIWHVINVVPTTDKSMHILPFENMCDSEITIDFINLINQLESPRPDSFRPTRHQPTVSLRPTSSIH